MSNLRLHVINKDISEKSILSAQRMAEFDHEVNKQHVYEDYFCYGVIDMMSIAHSQCTLQIMDSVTTGAYLRDEKFDLSCFPKRLLHNPKKLQHCHVLVRMRLLYDSKIQYAVIVPIGETRIGYRSNYLNLHAEGHLLLKRFMETYLEDVKNCWSPIPLPRYRTLRKLKKMIRSTFFRTFLKDTA